FLGGGDALDEARFGEAGAVILEKDIPALLVELGKAAASAGQDWAQWSGSHREDLNAIVAKYA
ncbi:MAG: nitrite/sulfite reductase, partial [Oscillibacter sp.]|nr:nitrite/sulfite reductase [Oscillibacter sp.]